MVNFRTILIFFLLATFTTQSQTIVTGGDIAGNWTPDGNPYIIEGDLVVGPEDRLFIGAGVEILFDGPFAIEVYGRLEAIGTATDSITFSVQDTTGFANGTYTGWYGLGFIAFGSGPAEVSQLKYCNIEYSAGSAITCLHYDNLVIDHVTLRNNIQYGINLLEFSDISVENILVENNKSGGISINYSAPEISNFIIRNNSGSGLIISGSSNTQQLPGISNGLVNHNSSLMQGGGVLISEEAHADISNVEVYNNQAVNGGGIFINAAYAEINGCTISTNESTYGGGLYVDNFSQVNMDHVIVSGNVALQYGGGIFNSTSDLIITRSTIADNQAGIAAGGFYYDIYSNDNNSINSSIIWSNYPDEIYAEGVTPQVTYSDINGGYEGNGNIDADPLFAQPENSNYQLTWANFPQYDDFTSPCIDNGDPAIGLDPDFSIADMGAVYFEHSLFITSVSEKKWGSSIDMYPNPATNTFYINSSEEISRIIITNLNGQIVKDFNVDYITAGYPVNNLKQGIYLVQFQDKTGNIVTKKLVKN